jgi:deoxyribodipyrimidine photolyase
MNTAIWWIRRDLRLSDNQALAAAMQQANTVIPVFILDPRLPVGITSIGDVLKDLIEELQFMIAQLEKYIKGLW